MTERVRRLRDQSKGTPPFISPERALLITEYYSDTDHRDLPSPLQRARAFRHLLLNRRLHLGSDELIVGEKGCSPRAVPTYPELCCHSLDDLEMLNGRDKIPYAVSSETMDIYTERIIPFWQGRTMRDSIFSSMEKDWLDCYEAGVFTEFMEQRSPGHTVMDGKIYTVGMLEFRKRIEVSLDKLDSEDYLRRAQLQAMDICAGALIEFAERYSLLAAELAAEETDQNRKNELLKIARICKRVPAHAPETFHEAIQYYWFVHLGVTLELNPWDSFSPGKLDQHLYTFFESDVQNGRITEEYAVQLLQCLWIKFNNQPAPPKVGVTASESSTYTDFAQINTGGLTPDGSSGYNRLSSIIIDVAKEMRLLQPSLSVQISRKSEKQLLRQALDMLSTGFGQPSIFNADMIVQELLSQGKSMEDAMHGGTSGCVETGTFGRENYNLSGYFNLVKILEITLNSGIDPATGKRLGPDTGTEFTSMQDLLEVFGLHLKHFADIKIQGNGIIEELYAEDMPAPFLSVLIDDCIENGLDYHAGGARYNTTYIQCVGLGSLLDSISAIQHNVFRNNTITIAELMKAVKADFKGFEKLQARLSTETPRYGNDDDRVDVYVEKIQEICLRAIDGRPNGRGGEYHINFLPTTVHVYFGSKVGAMPDGRNAGEPLSEGISPVQGTDHRGPTAVMLSAVRLDHSRTGGTLLNQKFLPPLLQGQHNLSKVAALILSYFALGGHHVQLNVVDRETLLAAKDDPDGYRNLIVRVAGYSDYFCDLSGELQNEIIARTAHGG